MNEIKATAQVIENDPAVSVEEKAEEEHCLPVKCMRSKGGELSEYFCPLLCEVCAIRLGMSLENRQYKSFSK